MWVKKILVIVTIILTAAFLGCIEPYNPPEVAQAEALLVVDGYVDLGTESVTISLTRTKNLSESNLPVYETNAQVSLEIEGGSTIALPEVEGGIYAAENISLSVNDKCKLRIRAGGKEYESELVSVIPTPEIDSVTYAQDASGVQIDVTTHDPNNKTWFYQWQYVETARYHSKFASIYYWRGPDDIASRNRENDIYVCWKTLPSTNILIATSSSLSSDFIYKFPVIFIPATSWKLEYRYSILVRQFAIDEDTYNYWQQIKKNTETIGSLFDPQPSQVNGNIRCVSNPSESVLGYFSVRSVTEKRLYIDRSDLPDYKSFENGYEGCLFSEIDTLLLADLDLSQPLRELLISAVTPPMGTQIIGYTTQNPTCIDCRLIRQGTTQRPEWWEE